MDMIDQLQQFRLENKMTQQELAGRLGVHLTTVNRWLNRIVKPSDIWAYQIKKLIEEKKGKR